MCNTNISIYLTCPIACFLFLLILSEERSDENENSRKIPGEQEALANIKPADWKLRTELFKLKLNDCSLFNAR